MASVDRELLSDEEREKLCELWFCHNEWTDTCPRCHQKFCQDHMTDEFMHGGRKWQVVFEGEYQKVCKGCACSLAPKEMFSPGREEEQDEPPEENPEVAVPNDF